MDDVSLSVDDVRETDVTPAVIGCVANKWSAFGLGRKRSGFEAGESLRNFGLSARNNYDKSLAVEEGGKVFSREKETRDILRKAWIAKQKGHKGVSGIGGAIDGSMSDLEEVDSRDEGEVDLLDLFGGIFRQNDTGKEKEGALEDCREDSKDDILQLLVDWEEMINEGDELSILLSEKDVNEQNPSGETGLWWTDRDEEVDLCFSRDLPPLVDLPWSVQSQGEVTNGGNAKNTTSTDRISKRLRQQYTMLLKEESRRGVGKSNVAVSSPTVGQIVVGSGAENGERTGTENGVGDGQERRGKEKLRLHLCTARMPGVIATSFVTPSPSLPYLPEVERAILEDNPHMMIFGAPGFVYTEFMDRLSSVFPKSARAAVFLHPTFDSEPSPSTVLTETSPLFYGSNVTRSGAVGLALSSDGKADRVPLAAFSEFVRMSLGFPPINGLILLEDSIGDYLFRPRLPHLGLGTKSSKGKAVVNKRKSQDKENQEALKVGEGGGGVKNWVEQLAPYLSKSRLGEGKNVLEGSKRTTKIETPQVLKAEAGIVQGKGGKKAAETNIGKKSQGRSENSTTVTCTSAESVIRVMETVGSKTGAVSLETNEENIGKVARSARTKIGEYTVSEKERRKELERQKGQLPLAIFKEVPFPGWTSTYKISDPKHRLMVRECVEAQSPCGIAGVLHDFTQPKLIGTEAILEVKLFDSDSSSMVLARGGRRFRVSPTDVFVRAGSFGLTMANVEYFEDKKVESPDEMQELKRLAKRACTLCNRVMTNVLNMGPRIGMRFSEPWLINNPVAASFAIAHSIPAGARVKLSWLNSTDTKMRLQEQMTFLKVLATTSQI